jgi:methionine sulfoxide reductase heme-binding subunit
VTTSTRRAAPPGRTAAQARKRRAGYLVTFGAWAIGLAPLLLIGYDALAGRLGADPVETLTHRTGWWALALLLLTLAVTPARRLTGLDPLIRARRPLGLFAFALASAHLLVYFVLDQGLEVGYLVEDIVERPFITIGFVAWLLLLPLAITSTRGWIRRLGRRWRILHRLVYLSAVLGAIHFAWGVKADLREPLIFGVILTVLLGFRVITGVTRRRGGRPDAGGRDASRTRG